MCIRGTDIQNASRNQSSYKSLEFLFAMTSLTGKTEIKKGQKIDGPPFWQAIGGAIIQSCIVGYTWFNFSSSAELLSSKNLMDVFWSDFWSRQVVITVCGIVLIWAASLRSCFSKRGKSDPSIVDRLWSIQPAFYSWHFYISSPSTRGLIMSVLVTLWAFRLTFNFARKGGFSGGEDYRWEIVQSWFPGWKWEAFNFCFVVAYQQLIILSFSSPGAVVGQNISDLKFIDGVAMTLFLLFLIGETIADEQMYYFQTEKYRRKKKDLSLARFAKGFIDTGLWGYSRHPNYFCEVAMWWCFYLFSVSASGAWVNFSLLGPLFLTLLFVPPKASCDLTEAISIRKYDQYLDYQRRVNRFLPWIPKE